MEVPHHALRNMVMRFLIWNDMYNRENNEKMKNKIIKYFIINGLKNPVDRFTELHKESLKMATSVWTALDVYIGDNSYNSLCNILNRVINMLKIKYPKRLMRLYQEYKKSKVISHTTTLAMCGLAT